MIGENPSVLRTVYMKQPTGNAVLLQCYKQNRFFEIRITGIPASSGLF